MKSITLKVFGILVILLLSLTQKVIAQIDLSGNWAATCILEKSNESTISFCEFCQYSINMDNTEISFEIFEMAFEKDYFKLITNDGSTKVIYEIKDDIETLEFTYKEKTYEFKILTILKYKGDNYILRDSDGMLILLERKEE